MFQEKQGKHATYSMANMFISKILRITWITLFCGNKVFHFLRHHKFWNLTPLKINRLPFLIATLTSKIFSYKIPHKTIFPSSKIKWNWEICLAKEVKRQRKQFLKKKKRFMVGKSYKRYVSGVIVPSIVLYQRRAS